MGSLEPSLSILLLTGHSPKVASTVWDLCPSASLGYSMGPEVQVVILTPAFPPMPSTQKWCKFMDLGIRQLWTKKPAWPLAMPSEHQFLHLSNRHKQNYSQEPCGHQTCQSVPDRSQVLRMWKSPFFPSSLQLKALVSGRVSICFLILLCSFSNLSTYCKTRTANSYILFTQIHQFNILPLCFFPISFPFSYGSMYFLNTRIFLYSAASANLGNLIRM